MKKIIIDGNSLTLDDLVNVARYNFPVEISKGALEKVKTSRQIVDDIVEAGQISYGITTGFGKFSDVAISKDECRQLQTNLIMSHSCGVGDPLSEEIVRAMMLLRSNALSKGYSGARCETLEVLTEMLNKGVHPIVPEKGSLGSSGDLAPLSHMVLTMLGLGEATYKGKRMESKEAMEEAGIKPLEYLGAKEGLALINGTQCMTAVGAITVYDAMNLMKTADISLCLTMEALNGITCAMDERVNLVRPHKGQFNTAKNVLTMVEGSEMVTKQGELRTQDAYSLRCSPQIHGASKDALEYVKNKLEIEMNSVTDNPIIFPGEDQKIISGGNFHGQPMALSFDFLGIALAEMANIAERRLEKMVNPALSYGLPAFLVNHGGLNSGFMIVQYSAASLVSENKVLAHPASVDSIPSSANQESCFYGTIAARKARDIMDNVRKVIAMEILTSVQAIDLRGKKKLGVGTEVAYNIVRDHTPFIDKDRIMYKDINICEDIIKDNLLVEAVEDALEEEILLFEDIEVKRQLSENL